MCVYILFVCKRMCLYRSSEYADDSGTNLKNFITEKIRTRTTCLYCKDVLLSVSERFYFHGEKEIACVVS